MDIKVITSTRDIDMNRLINRARIIQDDIVVFPEKIICHAYDLCDNVLGIIDNYHENNKDLVIVTYSEIVFDTVRLWTARNQFENTECINIISDETEIISKIDKDGNNGTWVDAIFDVKQIILKELLEIRIDRQTSRKEIENES